MNALEIRNVTKRFGKVVANKDINLTVEKGEILAVLGENGSGKTTLMNMIAMTGRIYSSIPDISISASTRS